LEKREQRGVVGVVIGELVVLSAAGPDADYWPVVVKADIVVVMP
jgi:hypothetical protein